MYNPTSSQEDVYKDMYVLAVIMDMLENLSMEKEFAQRFAELRWQAWEYLPEGYTGEFPKI